MDICPGSVRVLGTRAAKTSRLGMERVLLFSVISLVGFVRGVERNRAHNPTIRPIRRRFRSRRKTKSSLIRRLGHPQSRPARGKTLQASSLEPSRYLQVT
jgi:hypothetical protein